MVEGLNVEADDLIKAIELVFDSVRRSETSLRQLQYTDNFGMSENFSAKDYSLAGKARLDHHWQEISDVELEACGGLFGHMEAEEFCYYLPAYLRYSVKNLYNHDFDEEVLGSTLFTLSPIRNGSLDGFIVSKYALLNATQKTVIVQFLQFMAKEADWTQMREAELALEYWNKPNSFKIGLEL
jgi:hypothetical protein